MSCPIKKGPVLSIIVFLVLAAVPAAAFADISAGAGAQFHWWDDNADNRGSQFFVPVHAEYRKGGFVAEVLAGYATTHFELNPRTRGWHCPLSGPCYMIKERGNGTLSNPLDTKIRLSYEVFDEMPFDAVFGLDISLPTGRTDLGTRQIPMTLDKDLMPIVRSGEGININPTISIAKEWGNLVTGISAGYVFRGSYEYGRRTDSFSVYEYPAYVYSTRTIEDVTHYEPGDMLIVNGEARYYFNESWNARAFGSYVWYDEAAWNVKRRSIWTYSAEYESGSSSYSFVEKYQEGPLVIGGAGVSFASEKWEADASLRGLFRSRNRYADNGSFPEKLRKEDSNSHGDEWIADLSAAYHVTGGTTLTGRLQGLWVSKNRYDRNEELFVGRREKFTLGLGANHKIGGSFDLSVMLQGFLMHDAERPEVDMTRQNGRSFRGFGAGTALTYRF